MNCKFLTAPRLRFRVLSRAPPLKRRKAPRPEFFARRVAAACCAFCVFSARQHATPQNPENRQHNLYTGFALPVDGVAIRQLCHAGTTYCSGSPRPVFFDMLKNALNSNDMRLCRLISATFLLISALL